MTDDSQDRTSSIPVIHRAAPPGSSPGTLTVDPSRPKPRITAIGYSEHDHMEIELESVAQIHPLLEQWPVLWVNIDGLGDEGTLRDIGDEFKLHRLALEDVVNIPQRAKVEPYDEHLFLVARMIRFSDHPETEQVSLFVGAGFVLTFQERVGDSFDQVRHRIRLTGGRIRRSGTDYLAYALIDALIDGYYPVLEKYGEQIEDLEQEVITNPGSDLAARIHTVKRELLVIRRALGPHREALNSLLRDETTFVHESTRVYLRDCYDHIVQLLDMVETYRELSSGLLDVHLTTISNNMNDVMKVLTIFAAIFIPLSFICGLYGMNFTQDSPWNMPELRWAFGYPAVLLFMAAVAGGLLWVFRRRGWLGSRGRTRRDSRR